MRILLIIPTVLSALVTAAHFLRSRSIALMVVSLLAPFLLLIRRRWALLLVQLLLLAAALEWLWTMLIFTARREAQGQPALRLVVILSSVAAFCILSAVLLSLSSLRRGYANAPRTEPRGFPVVQNSP